MSLASEYNLRDELCEYDFYQKTLIKMDIFDNISFRSLMTNIETWRQMHDNATNL